MQYVDHATARRRFYFLWAIDCIKYMLNSAVSEYGASISSYNPAYVDQFKSYMQYQKSI